MSEERQSAIDNYFIALEVEIKMLKGRLENIVNKDILPSYDTSGLEKDLEKLIEKASLLREKFVGGKNAGI